MKNTTATIAGDLVVNKSDIIDFFNTYAPSWDAAMIRSDKKIERILDYAGVTSGMSILDVACGTGILIQDYLDREVAHVLGVDISPAMVEIAKAKFTDQCVEFLCADVQELAFESLFDCAVVYNAFPHFMYPQKLLNSLAGFVKAKGRVTVAHGMSRDWINNHHGGSASRVSVGLMSAEELASLFTPHFSVDVCVSNDDIYVISGTKNFSN